MQNKLFLRLTAALLLLCLLLGGCAPAEIQTPGDTTQPQTTLAETTTENTTTEGESLTTEDTTLPPEGSGQQTDTPVVTPDDTTEPPTTVPVTTEPPTTVPVTTEPPTTVPAATEPPTTVPVTTAPPTTVPVTTAPPADDPVSPVSGFAVHFIDVGQADASLVICDGKTMLIDGGNADDSNLIYTYLQKQGITHLDYIVATHAHEDHVGGLSGALNYATVGTVFSPVSSYSSKAFQNFAKNVQKQGKSLTCPSVGQSFSLGSATCRVLAVNTTSDTNNSSIVLRVVYGNTSFLFTGDAEREVEQVMIDRGEPLSATVLKVGHHGSYTSSSYAFLWNVMPQYAVISCGKGNSYGHPHDEPLSRLRDADVQLFRTDMQGDIICTSNGSSVSFSVSRNRNADVYAEIGGNSAQTTQPPATNPPQTDPPATNPPESDPPVTPPPATDPPATNPPATDPPADTPQGNDYILNTNSHKFHYPDCHSAAKISQKNKAYYTGTREELIAQGYSPCGNCDP